MALSRRRALAFLVPAIVAATTVLASASTGACYDFEYVEPAPAPDAGDVDAQQAGDAAACAPGRSTCGGDGVTGAKDTLYRCLGDGGGDLVSKCAGGCAAEAGAGGNSACNPPPACVPGGTYCGGDKLDGDPAVLYRCAANGIHAVVERCAKGCAVAAAGKDDACKR